MDLDWAVATEDTEEEDADDDFDLEEIEETLTDSGLRWSSKFCDLLMAKESVKAIPVFHPKVSSAIVNKNATCERCCMMIFCMTYVGGKASADGAPSARGRCESCNGGCTLHISLQIQASCRILKVLAGTQRARVGGAVSAHTL